MEEDAKAPARKPLTPISFLGYAWFWLVMGAMTLGERPPSLLALLLIVADLLVLIAIFVALWRARHRPGMVSWYKWAGLYFCCLALMVATDRATRLYPMLESGTWDWITFGIMIAAGGVGSILSIWAIYAIVRWRPRPTATE